MSGLTRSRVRTAWLFLLPMLATLMLVAGWPLLRTIYFGFTDASLSSIGNHDFIFQESPAEVPPFAWIYLEDSGVEINGLKIWGSPWQLPFFDWAYNMEEEDLVSMSIQGMYISIPITIF